MNPVEIPNVPLETRNYLQDLASCLSFRLGVSDYMKLVRKGHGAPRELRIIKRSLMFLDIGVWVSQNQELGSQG